MKQIDECHEILADPYDYIRRFKAESQRKVVGTFCSYAPEEIILAAGGHPFRVFGSGEKIRLAEAHLQSYCCSLVRGALEDALGGRLDFLDGVVFPHTCDSIQRLSDIWRLNVGRCFHTDLVLPVKLDTDSARQYMIDVLRRFRGELAEKLGVTISDDDLRGAIRLCNRIRIALTRIDDLKSERPGILKGSDFYALTRAAMILDRKRAASLLEEVAEELEKKSAGQAATGAEVKGAAVSGPAPKRVILSGGVCNHPDIYTVVEEAGGTVVGDDLCTGSRSFSGMIDETADPITAIAGRYLARVVCPAKHRGLADRADHLVRLVRQKRAQGVVFFLLKFCDPHAFDYPYLKEALDREGILSMVIEVEDRLPADGQLRTRFEAFVEMI
ncbi:MAG: 2-hydroxyacyl-CoA dehydratase family protein [Proteobacteria bacterium]|nr:2-hydroxyacyl-CoA dehydratase family protein [Pseudomonadota bacterium]MBU2260561.1 2-hydroxyacyl-CoA dehydratase family protein [Pseudomonadota bacterium]